MCVSVYVCKRERERERERKREREMREEKREMCVSERAKWG